MPATPGMPEFMGIGDQLKRMQAQIDKLNRMTRLESASVGAGGITIDGGGLFVKNAAGSVIVTLDEMGLEVEGTSIDPPPIGSGMVWFFDTAPTGYLLCQGQAVSRTTFADLHALAAAAGYPHGNGDGSTTFNLPDLRQRFPLGKAASGTGSTLGDTGGAIDHTHTGPSHTHSQGNTGSGGGHTHASGGAHAGHGTHDHSFSDSFQTGVNINPSTGVPFNVSVEPGVNSAAAPGHVHSGSVSGTTGTGDSSTSAGGHTHDAIANHAHTNPDTGAAGTGATGSNNPPFQVVNYIIKH